MEHSAIVGIVDYARLLVAPGVPRLARSLLEFRKNKNWAQELTAFFVLLTTLASR